MNLADKPCYPSVEEHYTRWENGEPNGMVNVNNYGLTFRERLIIALATAIDVRTVMDREIVSNQIVKQADALIKEVEK